MGLDSVHSSVSRLGRCPAAQFPSRSLPGIRPGEAPRPLERQTHFVEDHTSGEEKTRLAPQDNVNLQSQRTRLGMERAEKRGVRIGRPRLRIDLKILKKLAAQMALREIGK